MNEPDDEHLDVERILRRTHPTEPSAELKAKVVGAAWDAWRRETVDVPWRIPLRRLITSAAAAVVIASLANLYSDHVLARRSARAPMTDFVEPCDLDVIPDVRTPLIRYMAKAASPAQPEASALMNHLETIREALREVEQTQTSKEPTPIERESHLPGPPSSRHS